MARILSMKDAINEALDLEMRRDPTVIIMGEDIAGGAGAQGEEDAWGGVLGVTKGLIGKYGAKRVMDTPLSESAYIGAAVGAAACGLRPVAELMFLDFMGVCFDQIFNQAAKFKYMFGGKAQTPVVIRGMVGGGFRAAAQHSQMLTPLFTHIPGLKVVCPSNAYDAKGLLIQSIRDNDPVIFCEHNLYTHAVDVPAESYTIPFGEAAISREGKSATIVTYGLMVHRALEAAETLAKEKIDVEVIDLRTLSPIDLDTVIESVEKTGRLVAVDEANPRCSIASDVIASVMEHAFKAMKSAPRAVTAPHTPVPFSPTLEDLYIPSAAAIAEAVRGTMK